MPLHSLKERTYLDASGKATTDESKAVSLLGIENDEITLEQAYAVGLVKDEPKPAEVAAPVMQYYGPDGKRADAPVSGGTQFLSDDPTRPDAVAPESPAPADGQQDYSSLKKADLLALAEERDVELPADAKVADIRAALSAADEKE